MDQTERFLGSMSAYELIEDLDRLSRSADTRSPIRPKETIEAAHRRAGYIELIDQLVLEMKQEIARTI